MDNTPATANAKASERDSHLLARRLELATETAGIGIYEAELATGWAFYSEGFLRNLGYGSGDWRASQEEWFARLHPDERAILEEAYLAVQDGSLRSLEYRMRHRDGSYRWFLGHGKGIDLDAQGRARRIVGLCIDITERRQAESQLQATRQQLELERAELRATLDALIEPHVLLAPVRAASGEIVDFQYQDANTAACRYNRLSREQLLGRSLLDLFPAHMATGLIHHYTEAMESGTPLILNDYVYPNDLFGEERRYDIRAVRVGNRLSYSWRDVTERYRSAAQLRNSEQRYRLLAENSTDVVVHMRDARIVWVSPSLTAALGWDPQDWIGQPGDAFLDPDHRDTFARNVASIAPGQPISVRHRIRAKGGSWHWMDTKAQTFLDGEGQPDGLLATGRLVDAEVAASQALERKSAELASKLRTSLTASVVAHEINQPLSTVLLQARLIGAMAEQLGASAGQLQEPLASLTAEAERIADAIERMRMLLRNVPSPQESVDLAQVVDNALLYLKPRISQNAVQLHRVQPSGPLRMIGDGAQLQIAVANLIRNSLDALEQAPPADGARIEVTLTGLEAEWTLRIADNGPGFGELRLEDLPLTSTKHQGMGLGLFVVQTTTINHGGRMALGRSAGGGAEVILHFPSSTPRSATAGA